MKDKIIIFGTGQYWNNRKKYILNTCDIVCFLDNNPNKWNKKLCNKWINNPDNILNCDFDYVLIMCKSQDEIYKQLIRMGVSTQKIITYKQYKEIIIKEYYVKYGKKVNAHYDVICISTALNYNGGTMAVIYAVKALKSIGKKVLLCAEDCNEKLLDELINENIEILIAPSLFAVINDIIMSYIEDCEIVMVNVFQMLPVVCQLKGKKPVLWWIHEPEELYKPVLKEFSEYNNKALFDSVNIVAVSRIAQNNFNEYFYNCIKKTLAYSIPDILTKKEIKYEIQSKNNRIITFAIIGSIIERKAQDIFISAINQLSKEEIDKSRFYIIGSYDSGEYASRIIEESKKLKNIIVTGNLTREEMNNIYSKIDIVVCPSREDPLPIVMTEAMMYRKPCIASDSTGTADYIKDGINGFVCKTEDSEDLCEKMRYFIHHQEKIEIMGKEARKVYEEYFTMDKFADRLCNQMQKTIDMFNEKKMEELCR